MERLISKIMHSVFYPLLKIIQVSTKGMVYIAKNKSLNNQNHGTVVIKTFKKERNYLFVFDEPRGLYIPREMYFNELVNNKDVCPIILDYFQTNIEFCIVMEYLSDPWTDLYTFSRKSRSESSIRMAMENVVLALDYLINKGVYHLDIKPQNIMFNQQTNEIKIIDLEDVFYNVHSQNPCCKEYAGTLGYSAPEAFLHQMYDVKKSIVFMIGSLIYSCFESTSPFQKPEDYEHNFDNLMFRKCSKPAISLIRKCLVKSPNKRIEFSEIIHHKWLTNSYSKCFTYILCLLPAIILCVILNLIIYFIEI